MSAPARPRVRPGPRMAVVRLARHSFALPDGHKVGVAVAGTGMPLVMAHGYGAQGLLYSQTLSRLVSMGFKVIAIDTAGHGGTSLPALPATTFGDYVDIFNLGVESLGIRHAVFLGHSMGARLVAEAVAARPDSAVALVLVDAIVGESWDAQVRRLRRDPLAVAKLASGLIADTASIVDPSDLSAAGALLALVLRGAGLPRPGRLGPPAAALLRATASQPILEDLAVLGLATFVIHGERDRAVPLAWAREVATTLRAALVVVEGAGHSWLLRDPEALPGIVGSLLGTRLGEAWSGAVGGVGLDPAVASLGQIEEAMLEPNALLAHLAPPLDFPASQPRRSAHYRWSIEAG